MMPSSPTWNYGEEQPYAQIVVVVDGAWKFMTPWNPKSIGKTQNNQKNQPLRQVEPNSFIDFLH